MAGILYAQMLFTNYFFKYSTDVLLVAPAAIGTILFATRLWDAFSDPFVGYVSDATRTSWGRRRPWIIASALPVAITTWMIWNPPSVLGTSALFGWTAAALLLWETSMTTAFVPYMALGSEISVDHHERTRVSGARHLAGGVGYLAVIATLQIVTDSSEPRASLAGALGIAAPLCAAFIAIGGLMTFERSEHGDRRPAGVRTALAFTARNPHLRALCAIYLLEVANVAFIGLLGAHFCQYVLGDEALFPLLMGAYVGVSYLSAPLAVWSSRRLGKARVWVLALTGQGVAFATLYAAGDGDAALAIGCAVAIGLGAGCGHVVGPSILADVTDWDERESGERKEGVYYAAINVTRKLGFAAASFLVGASLQLAGFEPNVEQNPDTLRAIRGLFAFGPPVAFGLAVIVLSRFRLDEREHERIRSELESR
jgi:GPH family glycoside/pentoside/hexuronide:cation symporter